jgi:hypothetical protein
MTRIDRTLALLLPTATALALAAHLAAAETLAITHPLVLAVAAALAAGFCLRTLLIRNIATAPLATAAWPNRWQTTVRHTVWSIGGGALPAALLVTGMVLAGGRAEAIAPAHDLDVMLVIDWSRSMELPMGVTTRYAVARGWATRWLTESRAHRVGIVSFAGSAFLVAPLSSDLVALQSVLARDRPSGFSDGTAIGDALLVALAHERSSSAHARSIILLSDGANNTGAVTPAVAAEAAHRLGVTIYTVLAGAESPSAYEAPPDPELLAAVADAGGGRALRLDESDTFAEELAASAPLVQRAATSRPADPSGLLLIAFALTALAGLRRWAW